MQHGCAVKDIREIQYISGALLRGEQVGLRSDFPLAGALPDGVQPDTSHDCGMLISVREPERPPFAHTLHVVPRVVHVGVGCKKQTDPVRPAHMDGGHFAGAAHCAAGSRLGLLD